MTCLPGTACFLNAAVAWWHGEQGRTVEMLAAFLRAFLRWRGVT